MHSARGEDYIFQTTSRRRGFPARGALWALQSGWAHVPPSQLALDADRTTLPFQPTAVSPVQFLPYLWN